MTHPATIAMCGKGGVGKTTTAALIVKTLAERRDRRILAIDADPAVGLSYALGLTVSKTVDDIRNRLVDKILHDQVGDRVDTLHMLDYEIFDAMVEHSGFSLLAIGRPEGDGCYCEVNNLLKDIIETLSADFDLIIIDGEAGIEQINRRVMKTVDHLILVSDASRKSIHVAKTIEDVARKNNAVDYKRISLLLNRIRRAPEAHLAASRTDLALLGWLPEDRQVREYDLEGKSFLGFPQDAPAAEGIRHLIEPILAL